MNLANNLKRIRKENNLSQEQLAEKLGVSRQSVSKWEQGDSYPEMDKMIQLAKLFNLNVDDLLNQNIKEVNTDKQTKQAFNKGIEEFLNFVSKSIDMFSSLKTRGKINFLLEQIIIVSVLVILFLIVGSLGSSILTNLLSFVPWEILSVIRSVFESIYVVCALVFGFILWFSIFKTRYLDYYIVIKEESSERLNNELIASEHNEDKKIILEKKQEKVVIRDPKHSEYKFITSLIKVLLFIVKSITLIIALGLCLSLIAFVVLFVLAFLIKNTGLFFIGLLLMILSGITINLIVLIILFNFIITKKSRKKLLLWLFVSSLVACGLGFGLCCIGFTNFDYITDLTDSVYEKTSIIIPMQDTLTIDNNLYCINCTQIEYVVENRNDLRIEYKFHNIFEPSQYKIGHNLYLNVENNEDFMSSIRQIIEDLNSKKIINYSKYDIIIYTSKENILTLQDNLKKQEEKNQSDYIDELEEKIERYQDKIMNLEEKLENYLNNREVVVE